MTSGVSRSGSTLRLTIATSAGSASCKSPILPTMVGHAPVGQFVRKMNPTHGRPRRPSLSNGSPVCSVSWNRGIA